MKKLWITALLATLVFSCEDLQDSDPAMRGIRNGNEIWQAGFYSADIDFGGFLIEGGRNFERIQLVTSNDAPGAYTLGGENASVAIYRDPNGVVYSTANPPDPSLSIYPTDGQIVIDDVRNTEPKTIIGTFWFNAYTADGLNYVNFSEGIFYKVPLLGGLVVIDNGSRCLQATQQVTLAQIAFSGTDPSMPDYSEICNGYKQALMTQITDCGDSSGAIHAQIDALGDCM